MLALFWVLRYEVEKYIIYEKNFKTICHIANKDRDSEGQLSPGIED